MKCFALVFPGPFIAARQTVALIEHRHFAGARAGGDKFPRPRPQPGDVDDSVNRKLIAEEARRRTKGDDHGAFSPPVIKNSPVIVVERARDSVEDDVVSGRSVVRRRNNGHQSAGALASLVDKIRLPARRPQMSAGQKFTGGLFRGLGERGQMGAGLNH